MSFDWTIAPWLAVDCETTGVNPYEDRIVEVAVVEIDVDGNPCDPWSTIVDPGCEIPDEAAQVHGIPTSRAVAEGISPAEALEVVADRIFANGWRSPVVAFNASFDWPLLITEAERHGVEFPAFAPILDPYLIDRLVDRYRRGKPTTTTSFSTPRSPTVRSPTRSPPGR
jgi:DNA polymerase-3 subunit epsilon